MSERPAERPRDLLTATRRTEIPGTTRDPRHDAPGTDAADGTPGSGMGGSRFVQPAVYAALLLAACAAPARYVVVSEEAKDMHLDDVGQRLVPLSPRDAQANTTILGLRTRSSVEEYGRARRGDRGPLEEVLYQLISGRYGTAEETLRAHPGDILEHLRRLLVADLASEHSPRVPTAELLKMYQEAHDAQESDTARAIIKLRIRQLRYGR